jgi:hypothetical protein
VAAHLIMPAVTATLMAAGLSVCILARSAASITEATRGHFPLAAGQASPGVSMPAGGVMPAGGFMVEEATGEEVTDENDARTTVKSI